MGFNSPVGRRKSADSGEQTPKNPDASPLSCSKLKDSDLSCFLSSPWRSPSDPKAVVLTAWKPSQSQGQPRPQLNQPTTQPWPKSKVSKIPQPQNHYAISWFPELPHRDRTKSHRALASRPIKLKSPPPFTSPSFRRALDSTSEGRHHRWDTKASSSYLQFLSLSKLAGEKICLEREGEIVTTIRYIKEKRRRKSGEREESLKTKEWVWYIYIRLGFI